VLAIQTTPTSINPEQFARGALVLYALTFGWIAFLFAVIPSALVIGGVILMERGKTVTHVDPTTAHLILWGAVVIGLALAALVVWLFYWALKVSCVEGLFPLRCF
jgi:uncharacterized BrkB/YihY/UPF0761 family membrane protein